MRLRNARDAAAVPHWEVDAAWPMLIALARDDELLRDALKRHLGHAIQTLPQLAPGERWDGLGLVIAAAGADAALAEHDDATRPSAPVDGPFRRIVSSPAAIGVLLELLIVGVPFVRSSAAIALASATTLSRLPPLARRTVMHHLTDTSRDDSVYAAHWAKLALNRLENGGSMGDADWLPSVAFSTAGPSGVSARLEPVSSDPPTSSTSRSGRTTTVRKRETRVVRNADGTRRIVAPGQRRGDTTRRIAGEANRAARETRRIEAPREALPADAAAEAGRDTELASAPPLNDRPLVLADQLPVLRQFHRFVRMWRTGRVQVNQGEFSQRDLGLTSSAVLLAAPPLPEWPPVPAAYQAFCMGCLNGCNMSAEIANLPHHHYGDRKARHAEPWPTDNGLALPWIQLLPYKPGWPLRSRGRRRVACVGDFMPAELAGAATQAHARELPSLPPSLDPNARQRLDQLVAFGSAGLNEYVCFDFDRPDSRGEPTLAVYNVRTGRVRESGIVFENWINNPVDLGFEPVLAPVSISGSGS